MRTKSSDEVCFGERFSLAKREKEEERRKARGNRKQPLAGDQEKTKAKREKEEEQRKARGNLKQIFAGDQEIKRKP